MSIRIVIDNYANNHQPVGLAQITSVSYTLDLAKGLTSEMARKDYQTNNQSSIIANTKTICKLTHVIATEIQENYIILCQHKKSMLIKHTL